MDGGRRLLRSLTEAFRAPEFLRPAVIGGGAGRLGMPERVRAAAVPRPRSRRRGLLPALAKIGSRRGVGVSLAALLLGGSFLFGAVRGGQYADFVATYGSPFDFAASLAGFGLDAVTIVGVSELTTQDVLQGAGIKASQSLLFLDVEDVRDRLRALPLVQDVSVRKFYPDRLLIEINERLPFALWQRDGKLQVVAADGMPIRDGDDPRFASLPFVVGEGANKRVKEFLALLDAADDLRPQIRAGILIGQRRWNLKLNNNMDVKLPETGADAAVATLARMARDGRLLDKDLLSIDLRIPGRMVVRLTEEAAAARADLTTRKKGRGGPT